MSKFKLFPAGPKERQARLVVSQQAEKRAAGETPAPQED